MATLTKFEGLCGYLYAATLATNNLDEIKKFYVAGMGLTLEGPIALTTEQAATQARMWDLSEDECYDFYHLYREAVPSLVQLRLLVFKDDKPAIHKSYDSLELGPFSLGFPNKNWKQMDDRIAGQGFGFMAPMQTGLIEKTGEKPYEYYETIYKAPDFLHCVGIEREKGQPPICPVDETTGLGGPGYSAQVLDKAGDFLPFLTDVLDLAVVADWRWEASKGSALGVPDGTPFRFSLVYAKGTSQNHFLFLDFEGSEKKDPGVPPRIPNRGLGAWTLETTDIEEVHKKALAFSSHVVCEPKEYYSPIWGNSMVMTMHAPNGFIIEVFEKKDMNKEGIELFQKIIVGVFSNEEQVREEKKHGVQSHPLAKHVTEEISYRIENVPADFHGIWILEESYYEYPGKEVEIKPLLFKVSPSENGVYLESMVIPEKYDKKEVVNANPDLIFDYNELAPNPWFNKATYTSFGDHMKCHHECNVGNGVTFALIETLTENELHVMELAKKDGVKITPYDSPIIYKRQ